MHAESFGLVDKGVERCKDMNGWQGSLKRTADTFGR
jgi:hypothetical protein